MDGIPTDAALLVSAFNVDMAPIAAMRNIHPMYSCGR